jgi:hypothetical protein
MSSFFCGAFRQWSRHIKRVAVLPLKKKAVPATCHEGTRGERKYSSYSYLTSALDGGEWSASRPGRALPLSVPIGLEAGWAPEPVWTQGLG